MRPGLPAASSASAVARAASRTQASTSQPSDTKPLPSERKSELGMPPVAITTSRHTNGSMRPNHSSRDAAASAAEILKRAGAEEISISENLTVPGRIIHELGTARMGEDPKKSVLNKYNQVWDAKNVFVTDGAAFVNSANQNPTLTILALTIRACEYLTEELKRGNI